MSRFGSEYNRPRGGAVDHSCDRRLLCNRFRMSGRLLGWLFDEGRGTHMLFGELIGLAVGLVLLGLAAVMVLRFVSGPASRAWAIGLLLFMMLGNVGVLIEGVVALIWPPTLYLDTQQNQLEFNRGPTGEVFGVRVNNPPAECRGVRNRIWDLAAGNLVLASVALLLLRRISPANPAVAAEAQHEPAVGSTARG